MAITRSGRDTNTPSNAGTPHASPTPPPPYPDSTDVAMEAAAAGAAAAGYLTPPSHSNTPSLSPREERLEQLLLQSDGERLEVMHRAQAAH